MIFFKHFYYYYYSIYLVSKEFYITELYNNIFYLFYLFDYLDGCDMYQVLMYKNTNCNGSPYNVTVKSLSQYSSVTGNSIGSLLLLSCTDGVVSSCSTSMPYATQTPNVVKKWDYYYYDCYYYRYC